MALMNTTSFFSGLFPIPEYPEYEKKRDNGMWPSAYEVILTTLRYLAPATLLTLFWGQQSLIFRLLKHIDLAIRSIVYSSDEQRQSVLKWLEEAGPVKVEHLETVWRHGWILCGVLDSALPGACAGHPTTRLSLKHAQSIADDYLGVEPVFSHQELESNDALGKRQEWKLAQYLERIRVAIGKLTPPVSRPSSQMNSPENNQITMDYVGRGSGLTAAQINNKMYFKIYPTAQQSLDPGEIMILIKGPKDIYGMAVIPPLLGKAQMIRQKILGLQGKKSFTEKALPITHGAAYFRAYGKNDMNKMFHIPKSTYDINIEVEIRTDCARIGYIVPLEGKYDIYITSKGSNIVGSPYMMTASKNILEILEKDSFCLEDGEEIDILDVKTDRRVILRIVDFVTEKMLLKENGTFEKISEEEAQLLMSMDSKERTYTKEETPIKKQFKVRRFKDISTKVKVMLKICSIFEEMRTEKYSSKILMKKDIPDIVNSTLSDINVKREQIPQLIIPNSLTLLLKQERIKTLYDAEQAQLDVNKNHQTHLQNDKFDNLITSNSFNDGKNNSFEYSIITEDNKQVQTQTNDNVAIKIIIDEEKCVSPNTNPFVNLEMEIDRPKTPVLKIITGQLGDRSDSPYIEKDIDIAEEDSNGNEFINPFFVHEHRDTNTISSSNNFDEFPTADFIIGAPVSLPPLLKAPSPEPDMDSIILASNLDEALYKYEIKIQSKKSEFDNIRNTSPTFSNDTYDENIVPDINENLINEPHSPDNLTYHSIDSNFDNESQASSERKSDSFGEYCLEEITYINQDMKSKKDTWDSAYVSIDDNCSPDISNEDASNEFQKHKITLSDQKIDVFSNMGPAERELWESCKDLENDAIKMNEQVKTSKWDFKRHIFTPIIEESDRSLSTGLKDSIGPDKTIKDEDSVTKTIPELNEIFQEQPNLDVSCIVLAEPEKHDSKGEEFIIEQNAISVDSASGSKSDVMRQRTHISEGAISEVQLKVTEFSSASRALQDFRKDLNLSAIEHSSRDLQRIKYQMQFGEDCQPNLVLERKKYWDEKIRVIEEITSKKQHEKKTLCNDLKRNIQIKAKEKEEKSPLQTKSIVNNNKKDQIKNNADENLIEEVLFNKDVKLVEKWKKFWDEKLILEDDTTGIKHIQKGLKEFSPSKVIEPTSTVKSVEVPQQETLSYTVSKTMATPYSQTTGKQEIEEEVFKAFETSPKRFFGTSRKHIMNKLDLFVAKDNRENKETDENKIECEHGIVTSRVTQFHSIKVEPNNDNITDKYKSINAIIPTPIKNKGKLNVDKNSLIEEPDVEGKEDKNINLLNNTLLTKNITIMKNKIATNNENELFKPEVEHHVTNHIIKQLNDNSLTNDKHHKETQNSKIHKTPCRKLSASKSEMDIFSKINNINVIDEISDKYKSCEELPKVSVKNVISLYESVSKNSISTDPNSPPPLKLKTRTFSTNEKLSDARLVHSSTNSGLDEKQNEKSVKSIFKQDVNQSPIEYNFIVNDNNYGSFAENKKRLQECFNVLNKFQQNKKGPIETIITDIDIEIVDNNEETDVNKEVGLSTGTTEITETDYKSRFKLAKEYFQSLEDLRQTPEKKLDTVINSEMINDKLTESPTEKDTKKRHKKKVKSHSLPSSEFANIWSQMQEHKIDLEDEEKYVKISEKFNVDDLFNDVVGEGRLSRQGSFKGIPHKKAVLEMFKSMENISDKNVNSYDIAVTQLADFAKEKNIKNVQTYLTEYPYLPTTDPSKYHSRRDAKASGLISRTEMLNNKPRRNSVPDLRMNTKFIVNL